MHRPPAAPHALDVVGVPAHIRHQVERLQGQGNREDVDLGWLASPCLRIDVGTIACHQEVVDVRWHRPTAHPFAGLGAVGLSHDLVAVDALALVGVLKAAQFA